MRLAIAAQAWQDIDNIEEFSIGRWGQAQADRYLQALYSAIDMIHREPDVVLKQDDSLSPFLKFYRVNQHFIFCDVSPDRIVVLTIQHAARDLPERLGELEPYFLKEIAILHQQANRTK